MMKDQQITLKPIERSTLNVDEIAEYLGLSRDMIYILVREGRIPHIRIGRRILFKREAIDRYLDEKLEESMQDSAEIY